MGELGYFPNPIPVCLHDDVECDGGGDCARCKCASCRVVVSQICIITGEIYGISKEEATKCSIAFFSYSGHFQARNGHSGHFNQYSSFRSIRKFTFLNFR